MIPFVDGQFIDRPILIRNTIMANIPDYFINGGLRERIVSVKSICQKHQKHTVLYCTVTVMHISIRLHDKNSTVQQHNKVIDVEM